MLKINFFTFFIPRFAGLLVLVIDNGITMDAKERKIKQITALLLKYISRKSSEADQEELKEAEGLLPGQETWLKQFDTLETVSEDYEHYREITPTEEAWVCLEKKMAGGRKIYHRIWGYTAVAAVCTMVWLSVIFLKSDPVQKQKFLSVDVHDQALISLIIDGGKDSVNLRDHQNVKLHLAYVRAVDNVLFYDSVEMAGHEDEWHTLKVGKGGEYRLILSDGTVVWLNAESSLRYPLQFTGERRMVELQGEGFFQVAHREQMPFEVKTGEISVNVLGTVFNVMNYVDDPCALITLASGKVCVSLGESKVVLQPDEQARIEQNEISVRQVEARYYTSWIENRFLFDEEPLEMIVHKLARWYNLDFDFRDPELKKSRFSGTLPKYEDISKAFELLEMTTNVRFIMNQQTITIMKKK